MTIEFIVEPCPHIYFPENSNITVERMSVFADEAKTDRIAFLDFYIDRPADTTYHLFIHVDEKYRGDWTHRVVGPETANYFGTSKEVLLNLNWSATQDSAEVIKLKLENHDINKPTYFITGQTNAVLRPGEELRPQ